MRLELAEFKDRILAQVEALAVTQQTLQFLDALLDSGDRIWPSESDEAIEHLDRASERSRKFYAFIERSHNLPLAVVPFRLPLIFELQETEVQIAKLKHLLTVFRDKAYADFDQPVEQLTEIRNELDLLQTKHEEVLEQVNILLDRARFKEREYTKMQSTSIPGRA